MQRRDTYPMPKIFRAHALPRKLNPGNGDEPSHDPREPPGEPHTTAADIAEIGKVNMILIWIIGLIKIVKIKITTAVKMNNFAKKEVIFTPKFNDFTEL